MSNTRTHHQVGVFMLHRGVHRIGNGMGVTLRKFCHWTFADFFPEKQAYAVGGVITTPESGIGEHFIMVREAKLQVEANQLNFVFKKQVWQNMS